LRTLIHASVDAPRRRGRRRPAARLASIGVTVALALAAALAWGITSYASAPAARAIGVRRALGWSALVAPRVLWPIAHAWVGTPELGRVEAGWALLFGLGLVGALLLGFRAMTLGRVSIVATVISTDGAMAAVVSIARGETVGGVVIAGLTVIVAGVMLAVAGGSGADAGPRRDGLAALCAVGSAACFATTFLTAGEVGTLEPVWLVGVGRIVPLLLVSLPVLVATRLALPPRSAVPWIVLNGIGDVLGFTAYATAARDDLAVAAVVGSEYAVVTVVLGVVLLGERLRPHQWAGVAIALGGIAAVAASG
jgi:drug/metabolite transporter (DMT)-like permease